MNKEENIIIVKNMKKNLVMKQKNVSIMNQINNQNSKMVFFYINKLRNVI